MYFSASRNNKIERIKRKYGQGNEIGKDVW
jgi:hypothetical protein